MQTFIHINKKNISVNIKHVSGVTFFGRVAETNQEQEHINVFCL